AGIEDLSCQLVAFLHEPAVGRFVQLAHAHRKFAVELAQLLLFHHASFLLGFSLDIFDRVAANILDLCFHSADLTAADALDLILEILFQIYFFIKWHSYHLTVLRQLLHLRIGRSSLRSLRIRDDPGSLRSTAS